MANNVLYIVDTKTGAKLKIAKGHSNGHWSLYDKSTDRLSAWLEDRDWAATNGDPRTELTLMTENDPNLPNED